MAESRSIVMPHPEQLQDWLVSLRAMGYVVLSPGELEPTVAGYNISMRDLVVAEHDGRVDALKKHVWGTLSVQVGRELFDKGLMRCEENFGAPGLLMRASVVTRRFPK